MGSPTILTSPLGLVGPGRAGRAFARSWTAAGGTLAWVVARSAESAGSLRPGALYPADAPSLPPCDLVVIAVPDDAIREVARGLAGRLSCRFAFHLSGAVGSEAIAPLQTADTRIASLHPVRPFTGDPREDWTRAFVAVEGEDEAVVVGERIVEAVGGQAYRLSATDRALYHAAATLAAGGTAAVVSLAARGWAAAGIPEDVARQTLGALAAAAAAAVSSRPFADAFTGAIARRDAGTVRDHLASLSRHPRALEIYRALAEETLRRTSGVGREDEIRRALESASATAEGQVRSS